MCFHEDSPGPRQFYAFLFRCAKAFGDQSIEAFRVAADNDVNRGNRGRERQILLGILVRHRDDDLDPFTELGHGVPGRFDRIFKMQLLKRLTIKGIGIVPFADETDHPDA